MRANFSDHTYKTVCAKAVEVFEKDGHHVEFLRTQLERVCLFEEEEGNSSFPAVRKSVHTVLDMLTQAVPGMATSTILFS